MPDLLPLAILATCDYRGLVRGRGFPADQYETYADKGCGWVPANQMLTAFDEIAPDQLFGALGDLRLQPDVSTRVQQDIAGAETPFDVTLSDIVTPEGEPWECCPRTFLKRGIARYQATGAGTVVAAFENEFTLFLDDHHNASSFSVQAQRKLGDVLAEVMAALREAGLAPEMMLAEHGQGQFEVTMEPSAPLQAADRVIMLREILREITWRHGIASTFSPVARLGGAGNGVHIHIGFLGPDGTPAAYDPDRPGQVSEMVCRFAYGILSSYKAVCALTASSPVSYTRLQPGHWSAGSGILAIRNREAALRICPAPTQKHNPAKSHHIEYRAADATASPYLALGALLHAGADGLTQDVAEPIVDGDDSSTGRTGPTSLEEALTALESSEAAAGWASPLMREAFIANLRSEVAGLADMSTEEVINAYARIY